MAEDATRRTRLANERTFLAWFRTALAALGLAIALGKVLPEIADPPRWPYVALGILFAALAAVLALAGWWRQTSVERRLDGGEEVVMPAWLVLTLAAVVLLAAVAVAILVLVG
jgi:putative membrane protein